MPLPPAVSAMPVSPNSAVVEWESVVSGMRYFVQVAADASFFIDRRNIDVGTSQTKVAVDGLSTGRTYYFRLVSEDSSNVLTVGNPSKLLQGDFATFSFSS